jgi:ABC-2 type transport system permease protein
MPVVFQYIAQVIPLTHFLIIVRGLFLKGSHFADLAPHLAAMLATGTVIFAIS